MNAQRLTLIRRARIAVDDALRRVQWTDRLTRESLNAANRHLRAARKFVLEGAPEFAVIEMNNACTHLRQVLGGLTA
jgi:hypothetical protein